METNRRMSTKMLAIVAAVGALALAPRSSHAVLPVCNGFIQIEYVSGANFPDINDVVRVRLTLGSGVITGATTPTFTLNRVRFDLACAVPPAPGAVPCTPDLGTPMAYNGDGSITTTCPVSWTTSTSSGEVVFTPSTPLIIPASQNNFCQLEFDIKRVGDSMDSTPGLAEEVTGYNSNTGDGQCNNGLSSSNSQSGSIPLCPTCDDNNACTTESCDNSTGQCQTTSTTTCDDNNACTTESCSTSTGQCQTTSTVSCNACQTCNTSSGTCENSVVCNPCEICNTSSGGCVSNVTCNDNNFCTTESCNTATGQCQTTSTVTCSDGNACTTESCNTSTGQCQTTSTTTCDACHECNTTSGTCDLRNPQPPECVPSGCRITAGGIIPQSDGTTTVDDTKLADTNHDTFGGQVGAPCGCIGCFDEVGHIQGNWETSRKNRRGAFLAKEFTSLVCGCEDLAGNPVPNFDGITCGDREIGPTPPEAPANVACWSGVGAYNESNGRRTIAVGFRVEVEDRGEPGTGKNADNTDDLYHLQIWIPQQGETALGLAELACCQNPDPETAIGRPADVDDGNNHIIHGNIQIHDQIKSHIGECPVPGGTCEPLPQS
jgi:hypothetical protein